MKTILDNDIKFISGVGEERARLLASELSIHSLRDMLLHIPFRYIDRSRIYRISEITDEQIPYIQIRARVLNISYSGEGRKRRLTALVGDGSSSAELVWFQGIKWIEKRLEIGREYLIFGRPTIFRDSLSMVHPEIENIDKALTSKVRSPLQGIYSTTEKLSRSIGVKGIHNIITSTWSAIEGKVVDYMPQWIIKEFNLLPLEAALFNTHFPQSNELLERGQYRLKFDELLGLQLNIIGQRSERVAKLNGYLLPKVGEKFNTFYNTMLPFPLTGAQKRVIKEIRQDTVSGYQMNRLLQGDVGSGKTIVALISMLLAIDNGFQAVMIAPTEILARQHYASIERMCSSLGLNIRVLCGSTRVKERREILQALISGEVDIIIGTHALLEDSVQFQNLGFVVIDEQHRFGVEQRAKLWRKSAQPPHVLVMTATPIPRTLAMTLYGDLDVSVIDELPPGRKPIRTVHYMDSARLRLQGFMREQIALGRQIYVVYPLIKESEAMDYKDLEDGFLSMTRDFPLPEYNVSVCHGKMKAADKEESMRQFKSGEAQILVATSVIEVGVDVPNASVMVIESAERFGLSQMHQLRGRVGRGAEQSFCILMSGEKLSRESRRRLEAMCETNDGFRLSELDLQLRGAGDMSGTQQSGDIMELKVANPTRDINILTATRSLAERILADDISLTNPDNQSLTELRDRYAPKRERDFSMIS
ncbi:MAG: ATP-dependent DNA helicase RecG [Rikenellaceae bacterium]